MKTRKKILIVSVSAGAGHVRAAKALEKTGELYFKEFEVKHIDMMEYVSIALKKTMVDAYDLLVKNAPSVWGYIYKSTNNKNKMETFYGIIKAINRRSAKKFYEFVDEYEPDIIISTHSFPAQILKQSLSSNHQTVPVVLTVTDYGFHSFWITNGATQYYVATEKTQEEMKNSGISESLVTVTGIPIQPVFFEPQEVSLLRDTYHIPADKKVILVLAGGQGMMHSDEVIQSIFSLWKGDPLHIIAISGTSKKLEKKLLALKSMQSEHTLEVVGWTDSIDEYMRISDMIITKSGGITTTECLTLQKNILVVNPIPGQEEENAVYIEESGYGQIAHQKEELIPKLEELVEKSHPSFSHRNLQDGGAYRILTHIKNFLI